MSDRWVHLNLPAIAPHDMEVPISRKNTHRWAAGELMQPLRLSHAILDGIKLDMGSFAFSAQYLQSPAPIGGNMIKWEWFKRWDQRPTPTAATKIVTSWDTAYKADQLNDYSVGITAQVTGDEILILNVVREKLEFPDLRKRIIAERTRWKATTLLIEDKGSGTSLIQDLRRERINPIAIQPEGDKVLRMHSCTDRIEAGAVRLPRDAPWMDEFRTEILAFPHGVHDDQVDALSQLINWSKTRSTYDLKRLMGG